MHIKINIDKTCREPNIVITTNEMTEELSVIVKKLSEDSSDVIAGFSSEILTLLKQADIVRIYAVNGKVYADTTDGSYLLRQRLYELEERLNKSLFVRISNSEIINLHKVKNFDLSITGTICVIMVNKEVTYVSRRYVSKIKKVLGI